MRGHKRERIIRVLLIEAQPLSKNELSKRAKCTRQWVISFLKELEAKKLVKGTRVINPEKLIKYWLPIHKNPKKHGLYMVKEPYQLLRKTKLDYALTTYRAENLVQKYLFPSRMDIYIREEDREKWHKLLSKQGLVGAGNIKLIAMDDDHILYGKRKINKLYIVSIPQLIIDLFTEGGVCVEAAELLTKNVQRI